LDAQKYNHAYITKIYNLLIWDKKESILRESIKKLFDKRMKAKEDNNEALSETLKLLKNSGNGKFSQTIHNEKMEILDDNEKINEIYQHRDVIRDDDLANKEQCLLKYKIGLKDVQLFIE
jgi:hypothetical protein